MSEINNQLISLANKILNRDENILDNITHMWHLGNEIYRDAWNTEFHIFGVFDSDTVHLPLNSVQKFCSDSWLSKVNDETDKIVSLYQEQISTSCLKIIEKYASE